MSQDLQHHHNHSNDHHDLRHNDHVPTDNGTVSFPTASLGQARGSSWANRPATNRQHHDDEDTLTLTTCAGGKQRYTLHLPRDLIEQLRDAVYWTPGLTLASLAESALRERVDRLSRARGAPFPPRAGQLKPGRPLATPARRVAVP